MVSFSECIYRGYRVTAWAREADGISGAKQDGFVGRAMVAGMAAAVMDYRLPVPMPEERLHAQPATARHFAEAAARAYVDRLQQAHEARDARNESTYTRERERRSPQRAA